MQIQKNPKRINKIDKKMSLLEIALLEKVCQGSLRRAPRIVAVQTRGDRGHYCDRGVCQFC